MVKKRKCVGVILIGSMLAGMLIGCSGTIKKVQESEALTAPPELRVVCGTEEVVATGGNYTWGYELGEIGTSAIACGMHPLDAREYMAELAQAGSAASLVFEMEPTTVKVRCWKEDSWGNTSADSEDVPVEDWTIKWMSEAAIYEVTATWKDAVLDDSGRKYNGTASYTFYTVVTDSTDKKHLELSESDKEVLNEILGRYIKLEPELAVEEVIGKGESESIETEKAPDAEGQGMAEGNAGGSVCQFVKMIKVKDRVYISTDTAVDILRCGVMDGTIESTVENGVLPEENNQSNFGIGFGYQFRSEDIVDVNIDGKWIMFVSADAEIFIQVEEEADEAPLMTVTSDKHTAAAYEFFASSYTWGEHGWLCACGMDPAGALPKIADELPKFTYADDFSYILRKDAELRELVIYDKDFKQMEGVAELADLQPGKYYVFYIVEEKGRFIEKEEQYEVTTYYCVFEMLFSGVNARVG